MRTRKIRTCALLMCVVMMFGLCVPAMATNATSGKKIISESAELEQGTLFLEETNGYRVVYIVYDSDILEYAINYKDGSNSVDYGQYALNARSDQLDLSNPDDVVDFVMDLVPDGTYISNCGVAERQDSMTRANPTVSTTNQALTYARDWGPGYLPAKNQNLGNRTRNGITATTTERILFYASEDFFTDFSAGDFLSVIIALIPEVSLWIILDIIPYAWDYVGRRYATEAGELYMFTVYNDRMKTSRINDQTWYWAAWDYKFRVYSSTVKTEIEVHDDNMHYDYNENYIYFGDKALDNYFSSLI